MFPDFSKAIENFQEAAEMGYSNAMYNLAVCYEKGQGVGMDNGKYQQLINSSIEANDSDAMLYES